MNLTADVKVIEKVFLIQNINAYKSLLKRWLQRFHDVATKYLEWFRFLDTQENLNKNKLLKAQQHLTKT